MKLSMFRYAPIILLAAVSNVASPQRGGQLFQICRGPSDAPVCNVAAQQRGGDNTAPAPLSGDAKLPNGKSQRDAILKAEHEQNLKDAAQLVDLAQQLQQDLEKNDTFVFSISTLKKTDDIEKLVKKIRSRLRH
jgi:hypothetical protein